MRYRGLVIRPPSEAGSYILQVTYGCSHNACTFCPTYKGVRFSPRPLEEVEEDIAAASRLIPYTRRVFLADGNALCLPTEELERILRLLRQSFPRLERVGIYANGRDINGKPREELRRLAEMGLGIVYLGLESGDDEVLRRVRKRDTCEEMVQAVLKAKECGILTSVIVLLGLGGKEGSLRHARLSAEAVSRMNPHYLSALTLMVVPGTPLHAEWERGEFEMPDQRGLLEELREFISACRLEGCVFRTNHASNYLPLKGVLSRDRERLLNTIERAFQRPEMLRPEFMRAL
ncbi:radical SAM protein [Candidatus Solincola tengchongensis]|uniref:radical SAM protein n=1 Tax=Candidatus Solincola tengchongensis TaxID=2900693 RepID=UPI00257D8DA4|nr:radical SAM protein [Candidatus Solincola tengchongensis]